MTNKVIIVGGGLAGSEACYQLAKRGINVDLYEMKPTKFSPAHHNPNFAELVCSNSLKSDQITSIDSKGTRLPPSSASLTSLAGRMMACRSRT